MEQTANCGMPATRRISSSFASRSLCYIPGLQMGATMLIVYGLAASCANIAGGVLVSSPRIGRTALKYLIGLGAGFMLATVFLAVVPEAVALWEKPHLHPMAWLLAGYLMLQLFEHTIAPHFHFGEETHEDAMIAHHAALTGVGALMIHAFFDGVSITIGFLVNTHLGLLLFFAILLHKLPEGFTVASMVLAAGRTRNDARMASLLLGVATLAGSCSALAFGQVSIWSRPLSAYALPLSAGVTLYVAASDLIPEVNKREGGLRASLMVFAGVALFYLAELFF